MGEVIGIGSGAGAIEGDVKAAYANGKESGGEVAVAAEKFLGGAVNDIATAYEGRKGAAQVVEAALTHLLGADERSDLVIAMIRDLMWNMLKRPQVHEAMTFVWPDGVATYTAGDPRKQALLMKVLQTRLLTMLAPMIAEEVRKGWVAQIEGPRLEQEAAAKVLVEAEATETIAESTYRGFVRTGLMKLRALKRELKNLQMTEAQIHEIIPDAGPRAGGKGKGGKPETGGGGGGGGGGKLDGGNAEGGKSEEGKG